MPTFPNWQAGNRITAAALNSGLPLLVSKPGNQSVTSSTVLVNDTDLHAAVAANATYTFEFVIIYEAVAAADLAMVLTGPSGASVSSGFIVTDTSATTTTVGLVALTTRISALPTASITIGGVGGTTQINGYWSGTLTTSAAAGTFQLQWAQSVSNATATTILGGSTLIVQRVA